MEIFNEVFNHLLNPFNVITETNAYINMISQSIKDSGFENHSKYWQFMEIFIDIFALICSS